MSSEVEETLKRINSHKGVKGVLIMNSEGMTFHELIMTYYPGVYSQVESAPLFLIRAVDDDDNDN